MPSKTTLTLRVQVTQKEDNAYTHETVIDRSVSVIVPPAVDPMDELHRIVTQEFGTTKNYFDQLPQAKYRTLEAPRTEVDND